MSIAGKKMRIFIVDDDVFYLNLFTVMLEKLGYANVYAFSSAREALDKLTLDPHVVILDRYMDGITGDNALKRIKMNSPATKVVMVSGQRQDALKRDLEKYGADEFIEKGPQAVDAIRSFLESMVSPSRWKFWTF